MNVESGTHQWLTGLRKVEQWLLRKKDALEHPYLKSGSYRDVFPASGPVPSIKLISESGLYKLIMRSDKPIAATFQDWVTQEVLPSIRRTGSYSLPGTKRALLIEGADCGIAER